jgi:TolB-like protein/Tfp pilus assembly protein PilF
MSASVEGYSYDIFISYRQNDNKYDGWVTDFYNNLKKELDATIKQKLTIYFDENPVDGLLETHSVDKTIEEKLKCLIFIPVISQTYCDTESYAWQYEFRVFNKFAKEDRFGREIRLPNKNVASRILPVRIHELDPEDRNLVENELGAKLRSIDFIYRSAGVNRPLRTHEDHPKDNLNKTYYRDQINKVANGVKDIINALKNAGPREIKIPESEVRNRSSLPFSKNSVRFMVVSLVSLILIASGFYFIRNKLTTTRVIERSIAVLPFRNDSPSDSNTYFINGIMEEVLHNLQRIKDLRIISRTSVEQYRNSSKSIPQIAKELSVNYIVEGSGQRYGNSFKLNVQLVRARNENYIWGKLYEQKISMPGDIINVQSSIAKSIVSELQGTITPQEKIMIEKIPTSNLTAYDFYQKGNEEFSKFWIDVNNTKALLNAENFYNKALVSDPSFANAIAGKAEVYWNKHNYINSEISVDTVIKLADLSISFDDKIAEAYIIKGWCYDDAGLYDKALKEYSKAIELNPNNWKAYFGLANLFYFDDPVKSLFNLHKAVSLTHGSAEMPTLLRHIGGELLVTGYIEEARSYFSKAFELDGDSAIYFSCMGGIEQNQGNYDKALEFFQKAYSLKKDYSEVIHNIAVCYQLTGKDKQSLEYFKKLELQNALNFDLHRVGLAYWKSGLHKEGDDYFNKHLDYCNSILKSGRRADLITYTYYDLAGIYAFRGDKKKAYENLKTSGQSNNCFLYMLTLIKNDPFFAGIKTEPEFQHVINQMEVKYNRVHDEVGSWLHQLKLPDK